MKLSSRSSGMTLIEMLIVITVIGILSALILNALTGVVGPQARDSVRMKKVQEIATLIEDLQGRFHVPPIPGTTRPGLKYPAPCDGTDHSKLAECFVKMQIGSGAEAVAELFTVPKHQVNVGNTQSHYAIYYKATENSYKICTFLENQGAFEHLNATNTGATLTGATSENEANMYCLVGGVDPWGSDMENVAEVTLPSGV